MLTGIVSAGIGLLSTISPLALGRRTYGFVLDTLLGPAEGCEYVSKTDPNGPPPYIS